jgi:hypothetical protein
LSPVSPTVRYLASSLPNRDLLVRLDRQAVILFGHAAYLPD